MPANASPVEVIHECAANLKLPAKGIESLAAQCPDLKGALTQLGYTETLAPGWREGLTPGQLEDLTALATRYHLDARPSSAPDARALRGILEGLRAEQVSEHKSWWESIKDWLRSWFSGSKDRDLSWLERWFDKLGSATGILTLATYALVALIIGASLYFMVAELRSAGVFAPTRRSPGRSAARVEPFSESTPPLDQVPLPEQPAVLLAMLVRSLSRSGRLIADRHLTHRELVRAVELDDTHQHARLSRLAEIAEKLLYGAQALSAAVVQSAVADGRELLRQLDRAGREPS